MMAEFPHRRRNLLTGEWVLVSPHRTRRPWQGQTEQVPEPPAVDYDPKCYLCPGNERAGGLRNPPYRSTFVFPNDFAALLPDVPDFEEDADGLLVARSERGICRVVCFSPRHSLTLARMSIPEIDAVIETWTREFADLSIHPGIAHVQIFENRGEMMGASNPHPHCQVWATESIPNEVEKELRTLSGPSAGCALCRYAALECRKGERIVCENEHFLALVPFWALWPFETLVLARRHLDAFDSMRPGERDALADILKRLTTRYDNLFQSPFPYTMGFHQRPVPHFHAHFYPPLLRSASVRKFMVGFEMLATPQRDITPESAAARLRELSETHYRDR